MKAARILVSIELIASAIFYFRLQLKEIPFVSAVGVMRSH
jgi:hypothetical protein